MPSLVFVASLLASSCMAASAQNSDGAEAPSEAFSAFCGGTMSELDNAYIVLTCDEAAFFGEGPPFVTRWLYSPEFLVAMTGEISGMSATLSLSEFSGMQTFEDEDLASHELWNPDYVARVMYSPEGDATLYEVQPPPEANRTELPVRHEYLTRVPYGQLVGRRGVVVQSFRDEEIQGVVRKVLKLTIDREADGNPVEATIVFDADWGNPIGSTYVYPSGHDGLPMEPAGSLQRNTSFIYTTGPQGIPILAERRTSVDAPKEWGLSGSERSLYLVDLNPAIEKNRFYLSYYGLPEPDFVKPAGWPIWVWLLVAGAALIVGGKLLPVIRRKSK